MRLWHQSLIENLPRHQLLGLHREVCALRGKGWGKLHPLINYVYNYDFYILVLYHFLVIKEMEARWYKVDHLWKQSSYRGKRLGFIADVHPFENLTYHEGLQLVDHILYKEHDEEYLNECIENLKSKGITIIF